MDFRHLVADDEEFLAELRARSAELLPPRDGGLEGLNGGPGGLEALAEDLDRIQEGVYVEGDNGGLEAIVKRLGRPVFFVDGTGFRPPADSMTLFQGGESEVVTGRLAAAEPFLAAAVPSVGRVQLTNHRLDWVGTGWVVGPELVVTNRHVAENFAAAAQGAFPFRAAAGGRRVKASLDWRREYQRPDESIVVVREVLWIEPDDGHDVALLRIGATDDQGSAAPSPIPLMTQEEVASNLGQWVAVIGYPAQSPYNDAEDQQRIFDGVYNVKRLAPGTVMSISPDGQFAHDATTLGGNSGSLVLDLTSGKAVGLHFGGIEGDRNMAVQASEVASLMATHG